MRQRARLYVEFAEEFDRLPPSQEPSDGWAKIMADICRQISEGCLERAKVEDPNPDPGRESRLPPLRIV